MYVCGRATRVWQAHTVAVSLQMGRGMGWALFTRPRLNHIIPYSCVYSKLLLTPHPFSLPSLHRILAPINTRPSSTASSRPQDFCALLLRGNTPLPSLPHLPSILCGLYLRYPPICLLITQHLSPSQGNQSPNQAQVGNPFIPQLPIHPSKQPSAFSAPAPNHQSPTQSNPRSAKSSTNHVHTYIPTQRDVHTIQYNTIHTIQYNTVPYRKNPDPAISASSHPPTPPVPRARPFAIRTARTARTGSALVRTFVRSMVCLRVSAFCRFVVATSSSALRGGMAVVSHGTRRFAPTVHTSPRGGPRLKGDGIHPSSGLDWTGLDWIGLG